MKIELKSIKYSAFMSEETTAFEAVVYVDGVKSGTASNRGYGDPVCIHPYALQEKIDAYAKTLPKLKYDFGEFDQDAESIINGLVTDWLHAKDLKRLMSSRILFTRTDNRILQTKKLDKAVLERTLATEALYKPLMAVKILNKLPFPEALSLYKELAA
jgi:hypothetical protein